MGRKGFTLVELLIFIAIFTFAMIAFITVLVVVTRVQTEQVSSNEVNAQSQFVLQQLQYYIGASSLVELPPDTATTTLKLRMANSSTDPTYITLSGGTLFLQQGSATKTALTSSKVTVSGLTFTKRQNSGAHDSVSIAFTVAYNTINLQQMFSRALQTSVARVSAATFDSSITASTTNTYVIGSATGEWKSINNTIFFSGAKVGIGGGGSFTPSAVLTVDQGNIEIDTFGNGLIMKDSAGVCWLEKPNTSGTITAATTTC